MGSKAKGHSRGRYCGAAVYRPAGQGSELQVMKSLPALRVPAVQDEEREMDSPPTRRNHDKCRVSDGITVRWFETSLVKTH